MSVGQKSRSKAMSVFCTFCQSQGESSSLLVFSYVEEGGVSVLPTSVAYVASTFNGVYGVLGENHWKMYASYGLSSGL